MNSFLAACPVATPSATASTSVPTPSPTATLCSKPQNLSNNWDSFYSDWVAPVVHFGVPALVLFVVFVALAVVATPALLLTGTRGTYSGSHWARWSVRIIYFYGVLCLAYAAVEVTVVYPLQRNAKDATWVAIAAMVLWVFAIAIVLVLFFGLSSVHLQTWVVCLGSVAAAVGCILGTVMSIHHGTGLDTQFNVAIHAPILGVLGLLIVGRARGIGMGLLIKGHDKTGSDDGGLGAFVQARLYALGSERPSGLLITQQTDVTSLPAEALSLIPSGTWAKIASQIVSWLGPSTPWSVDVTEQVDSSVIVAIRRNGVTAAATPIRPRMLGLPASASKEAANGSGGKPAKAAVPDASAGSAAVAPDWSAELRTAAAAFILIELSKRYQHLKPGLSGATEWISVAQQVIATDPTSQLDDKERKSLLVRAIASDSGNQAAELALLSRTYRSAVSGEHQEAAKKFDKLLKKVESERGPGQGVRPLELRLRFNLLVAMANYVAELPSNSNSADAQVPLECAKNQAVSLFQFGKEKKLYKETRTLWDSMFPAVYYAALGIEWESVGRGLGSLLIDEIREKLLDDENISLMARYEYACALTRPQNPGEEPDYGEALKELKDAVVDPRQRLWARTDPWLEALHDVDLIKGDSSSKTVAQFKGLIGDPLPADFLSLAPFIKYRDELADRGIHNAEQLKGAPGSVIKELGITDGMVTRWRNLTDLHQRLATIPPRSTNDQRATELVFLLLLLNLDSSAAVLTGPSDADLKKGLIEKSVAWAVVAPDTNEIDAMREAARRAILPPAT